MSEERWLTALRALDEAQGAPPGRSDAELVDGALALGRTRRRRKHVALVTAVLVPCLGFAAWRASKPPAIPERVDALAATDGLVERLERSRLLLESGIRLASVREVEEVPAPPTWIGRRWEARAAEMAAEGRVSEAEAFLRERRRAHPEAFPASGDSPDPDNRAR